MAWETRSGSEYYYRKRREGGKVKSEYIGAGNFADVLSRLDALTQEQRELERAALLAERDADKELDRQITDLTRRVQRLTAATLLASGFHQHWRKWRVYRGKKE